MYKCQVKGRTMFQDSVCPGVKDSQPYIPKAKLNTMSSEAITGKPKEAPDSRPGWLKPMDPIADCKAKGGIVDKELRACMLQ